MSELVCVGSVRLRPLNEIVKTLEETYERRKRTMLEYLEKERLEKLSNIEKNRQSLPLITEVVDLSLSSWENGDQITVDLGEKPAARAKKADKEAFKAKLISLRDILGNLKVQCTNTQDTSRKLIRVTLASPNYPGIEVRYVRKLLKTDKCQLKKVRHKAYTSYELVCDASR